MAALTAIIPTNAGALSGIGAAGNPVASSDTVSTAVMGRRGAILEIINGNAAPDSVTISDAGATPSGNALAGGTYAGSVANATAKAFLLRPEQANPSTGLITVTHSVTSSVTYKLYAVD